MRCEAERGEERRGKARRLGLGLLCSAPLGDSSRLDLSWDCSPPLHLLLTKTSPPQSNIDPKLFDPAANEVFKSMYAKSYRSFVSSDFFSQHKSNVFNEEDLNRTIKDLTRFASDRNLKKR